MDNSSTVTFFSPSLNNYWGGGGGGPSPSYGPEFEKRYSFTSLQASYALVKTTWNKTCWRMMLL